MADCPRAGKWFGCKFEARYDESKPGKDEWMMFREGPGANEANPVKVTYVHDVCVRCGRTIERS